MTDIVELSRDELLIAIRHDCVTFLSFYLADQLTLEVPQLHIDIWNQLLDMVDTLNQPGLIRSLKKLFAVPRSHAKSTLAKLACILLLKYTPLRFVLYTSKTNGHAKNAIRDILEWLASPQERDLYGAPGPTIKASETESIWILPIATRRSASDQPEYKKVIFKALGADQQVRGLLILNERPQIIIVDDIEDLDNTTPDQQPKLDEWFLGSLLKAAAKLNVIIFIGNMIRKTTLLARLSKDPNWNPTVYGSLVRDKETGELRPLWPGLWTVEALLTEYKEYRRLGRGYVWEAEMMNLSQDEVLQGNLDGAVRPPRPMPEMLEAGFITVDPAFGTQNAWNDDTAIVVHARVKGVGIPCVIDSRVSRMTEDEMFETLLNLSYEWGITTWLIESEAAQRVLLSYFSLLLQSRKMNPTLFVMLPVASGGVKKGARILTFRNSVSSGSYAVVDSEQGLVDKLLEYSPEAKNHDDYCDSAAYGIIGWQYYNETVVSQGIKQVALLAFGNGESAVDSVQGELQVAGF
jgi:hypothetical protein